MITLYKTVIAVAIILLSVSSIFADTHDDDDDGVIIQQHEHACISPHKMDRFMLQNNDELRDLMVVNSETTFELWTYKDRSAWVLLQTNLGGLTCMVATGFNEN